MLTRATMVGVVLALQGAPYATLGPVRPTPDAAGHP
jgi:hypothetical protein